MWPVSRRSRGNGSSMAEEGACVHQVRRSSVACRRERAVGNLLGLVDADAALVACSVVTSISVGFSLASRAKAQALRFPW
jgi:dUTPase